MYGYIYIYIRTYIFPQGSILSALLIILYVNGLHELSPRSSVLIFADDTTILFSHNMYQCYINSINTIDLVKY